MSMFTSVIICLLLSAVTISNPIGCHGGCLEAAVSARKEQIKRDLLDRLGLSKPPNISISDMPLTHVLQDSLPLFGLNGSMAGDQASFDQVVSATPEYRRATTELIVSFAKPGEDGKSHFNYTPSDYQMYVNKATLRVYLMPVPDAEDDDLEPKNLKISVYGVDKNGRKNSRPITDMKITHNLAEGNWLQVEGLQHSLNEWFSQQRHSTHIMPFALAVECMYDGINIVSQPTDSQNEHTMYLSIVVSNERTARDKRSLPDTDLCDGDAKENSCCRSRLRIEFAEFGWDWIIAPKFYDAYMCTGTCTAANTNSIHGHLTGQANAAHNRHQHRHHRGSPSPCCHPTEYSKLKIVFMKEKGTVEVSTVEGMIAQRCGCA